MKTLNKLNVSPIVIKMLKDEICSTLKNIYGKILEDRAYKPIKLPAKILFIDDEHIPFVNMDLIEEMLRLDGDADGFVWGEVLNFDAFAWYIKNYISNPVQEDEVAGKLIDLFLKHFKWGYTLDTNHTRRCEKLLAGITDPIQLNYLRKTFNGLMPTFSTISKRVKYVGLPVVQLGKAIFAHFDSFSSIAGRTVEWIEDGMLNWDDCYGIKEFDSCWIGHTHNQETHFRFQKKVSEVGCLCYAQDYLFRGKMTAAQRKFRWVNGYGVVYLQKDGSTDFKKSHLQFLGFARLPREILGKEKK